MLIDKDDLLTLQSPHPKQNTPQSRNTKTLQKQSPDQITRDGHKYREGLSDKATGRTGVLRKRRIMWADY
ncbi:hypothetical protein BOTNAR_0081g00060 [Botryotinia narcissicola]|uniref:Uncharacterized protein n=1 Tax=Botryotinia narcissicola TaxID=278944 RepID=A0A4Z1IUP2_9HELO|nr:hypothetical protein BOTNAR_0081g00060 [Botryotinia narcissicola]